MRRAIRAELWKAFHDPMLWIALAGGAFIALASLFDCAAAMKEWAASALLPEDPVPGEAFSTEGYSLFMLSLPYHRVNFSGSLFTLVWPILAAIPYGTSYMQERRTGVYNQIVSRIGKGKYYFAKYIAVFVTGGLVVAGTELAAFLADATVLPDWGTNIAYVEVIHNGSFMAAAYYTHPWAHVLCWCGVLFFIGGATACLTFFVWTGLRLRALAAIIPFSFYFIIFALWSRLVASGLISGSFYRCLRKVASLLAIVEVGHTAYPGWWALIIAGIITAVTFAVGYFQVVKHELD